MKLNFKLLPIYFLLFTFLSFAQNGKDAQWATAGKQGVGTSASLNSKVWFTLAQGVMTEVYYPDVTVANVHLLQFIVVNPKTKKVETEQDDAIHEIIVNPTALSGNGFRINTIETGKNFRSTSSLAFTQISRSKEKSKSIVGTNEIIIGSPNDEWQIEKKYVTNPDNNSVVFSVEFTTADPNNELYVYYDPSLANSGMHDTGWSEGNYLLSSDGKISSALTCGRCKFTNQTNGLLGVNDGLTQLKQSGKIGEQVSRVENGNLVQVAKVTPVSIGSRPAKMIFVLSFGNSPKDAMTTAYNSLQKGFDSIYREYQEDWANYLKTLRKVDPKYQAQFNMAAMILKAHEDKANRGANIASLTVPWGGGDNANENNVGGYHLVWSRDLYHVATAFMALGDKDAAIRALDFLFKVQQKPDGSFPQNSWLDGKPFWGSLQLDEVAFPLILAHELGKTDKETYENHVKKSADFIVKTGPITPQERWEERNGYSPSTIAAEIAGLVCAAEIAKKNGDTESANRWLKTADEWQANIEKWTVTTNGKYGDGNYYLRITQKGRPNAGDKIDLGNGAGVFDEREIVDVGFLELVRLGIKSPDDPLIVKSLKVIDDVIRVETPNGDGFYHYNHDGYGEMDEGRRWNFDGKYTGKGRLWALLSGERGQYELAKQRMYLDIINNRFPSERTKNPDKKYPPVKTSIEYLVLAKSRLDSMLAFANEGLMIPEQIWDKAETPKNVDKQFVPELKFG